MEERRSSGRRGTPTGSATSSVTTSSSAKRTSLANDDDDNYAGGYVGRRTSGASGRNKTRVSDKRSNVTVRISGSVSGRTPSSWAQGKRGRPTTHQQQQQQAMRRLEDEIPIIPPQSSTGGPQGSSTNNSNNNRQQQDTRSFRGWLTGSIFGALNDTIFTPAVGVTQNLILPSIISLVIDTLDETTSEFVKDWFRIISSSLYHVYSVLASTEQGKIVRRQLLLVAQTILEAWSAPESRQVVVDGMAAGVKLADAMHTPEMLAFLEQTSVLGCRVVDALSSGKAKQVIHNSKDLMWNGIELAVDPATTTALAEVTAHLCHALEETSESLAFLESKKANRRTRTSLNVTPRQTRDEQNKTTYLRPKKVTDYESETIENVILSSLGVDVDPQNTTGVSKIDGNVQVDVDEDDNDDDDTSALRSLQSTLDLSGDNMKPNNDEQDALWRSREESVNVDLLRDKILNDGRPKQRPSMRLSSETELQKETDPSDLDTNQSNDIQLQVDDEVSKLLDVEDVVETDRPAVSDRGHSQPDSNNIYTRQMNDKLDNYVSTQEQDTGAMSASSRFYQLVDRYMEHDDLKRRQRQVVEIDDDAAQILKARVKKLKEGRIHLKQAREAYSRHRRRWTLPSSLISLSTIVLAAIVLSWSAFGLYGIYMLGQVVFFQGMSPTNFLFPLQENGHNVQRQSGSNSIPTTNSNEMVIRIVREVVHVREDGTNLEGSFVSPDVSFSKDEMNSVMECVAAMEKSSKKTKK